MSRDLLKNATHVSDLKGTFRSGTTLPKDGDEIENLQAGDVFYDTTKNVFYGYDGTAWYGVKAFTTSTSSSTSTSTSTTTTA